MSTYLRKPELLRIVLDALDFSDYNYLIVEDRHPFLIHIYRKGDSNTIPVRIYIWTCTHGGGKMRADDEFRIQFTSAIPNIDPNAVTLLLGWHIGYKVFAGWDINMHNNQQGHSPSCQIKELALKTASEHSFATHMRSNGEITVAFKQHFLVEYIINRTLLHGLGNNDTVTMALLNEVDQIDQSDIDTNIKGNSRRVLVSSVRKRYRENDFRSRILSAYSDTCAFCGVQLRLLDASHIVPVAHESSTDNTNNGISLCSLHHRAYDNGLISFNERYEIEISSASIKRLSNDNVLGGLDGFRASLRQSILLPGNLSDYPSQGNIRLSRSIRKWKR